MKSEDQAFVTVDYASVFEALRGLYLLLTPDLTILNATNSYLKATMTRRESVVGHKLFDIFPDNPEEKDADGELNLKGSLNYVIRYKKPHSMAIQKYDVRNENGVFVEKYWSPINKPVLNSEGELLYIIHRVEDITDFIKHRHELTEKSKLDKFERMEMEIFYQHEEIRKLNKELEMRVEERTKKVVENEVLYRTIAQNIPGTVTSVIDKDERFIFVDGGSVGEISLDKNVMSGKFAKDVLSPERYKRVHPLYERLLSGERFSQEFEDKTKSWFLQFVPLFNEKKEVTRGMIIAMNTTQIKKSETILKGLNELLRKKAEDLENTNKELEQFAYVASHDLQEPLRMVSSFLQLLKKKYEGQLDETAQQYIHFAVDGAERMKRLILDLLEYSRAGKEQEDKVDVDLNEIVDYVKGLFKNEIQKSGAVIKCDQLPVIQSERTEMIQLFQNLIGNSLKYRSEKPPVITIEYKDNNDEHFFSIRDNGIGIDNQFSKKIFVIFQRLHNKNEYTGTGIGLAICKKIIDRNKGKIWVESESGNGSTFYFSISKKEA